MILLKINENVRTKFGCSHFFVLYLHKRKIKKLAIHLPPEGRSFLARCLINSNTTMKATVDDLRRELWLRKREKLVWETKNGQLIPLKLMSEEHLENAINYFDRMEEMREIVLDNQDILCIWKIN